MWSTSNCSKTEERKNVDIVFNEICNLSDSYAIRACVLLLWKKWYYGMLDGFTCSVYVWLHGTDCHGKPVYESNFSILILRACIMYLYGLPIRNDKTHITNMKSITFNTRKKHCFSS